VTNVTYETVFIYLVKKIDASLNNAPSILFPFSCW